jgi:TolB-like protein
MTLTPGTRLGIYEILGALGAGGMGEVYRARDTRLHRDVALKILPASVATDPDRLARFEREARVLASLNHPNVAQIYGFEESGDLRALVMELVDGEPLDRVIPPGGLSLDHIVEIGTAIAAALSAAHGKSIVHRDLKPANVMVTGERHVKVLDFGLAKEIGASGPSGDTMTSAGQTALGIVMGTPAYMSPEQVAGRAVDQRSDVFALGVLLYEMATGRRTFAGASSAELASAILRDTPAPLTDTRADLPDDLARVIRRCLEKDARDRIQTAHDVALELRDVARHGSGPSTANAPATARAGDGAGSGTVRNDEGFWVAVLPFAHQGTDTAIPAFTDGLTDEIVTGLSRFTYLRVVPQGSTRRFAGTAADVLAAGRSLNARYVMSGSVRQAGASLRVSAQLVDAATGANLWAETYTREYRPEAAFTLQDDLVPRIVSTVADNYGVLMHSMSEALRHRSAEELTPYEAVLRGYGYYERINAEEHREVRDLLEHVVRRAPGNADCHRLLATLYVDEFRSGFNPRPDSLGRALAAARRAVEAGPSNAAAHIALAVAHFFRKEGPSFHAEVERALALNPFDGGTIAFAGVMLAFSGQWERGCALAARARELNPHHPGWFWFAPCMDAYRRREYGEALRIASKFNLPGHPYASVALAASCGQLGDARAGRDAIRALLSLHPGFQTDARQELGKWFEADLVEHLIDGLRKAGLQVDAGPDDALPGPPLMEGGRKAGLDIES